MKEGKKKGKKEIQERQDRDRQTGKKEEKDNRETDRQTRKKSHFLLSLSFSQNSSKSMIHI